MFFRWPLLLCVIGLFAASGIAQSPDGDWQRVNALKPGSTISVETKSGESFRAKYRGLTADSLSIKRNGKTMSIAKNDIGRVYRSRKRSRLGRALIGAAAGAGIGTGIGVIAAVATKEPLTAAAGFLFGIPVGAVIGAATGGGHYQGELLYIAR